MFIRSLFSKSPASIYNNYYKKLEKATRENVLEVKIADTNKTKMVKVSLKKDGTLTERSWKKIISAIYKKTPEKLSTEETFILTPGNLNKKLLETRLKKIYEIYDKMETESKKITNKKTQPIKAIRKEAAAMMRIEKLLFDFKSEAEKKELETSNLSKKLNSFSVKLANKENVKKFFSIYVKGDLKKEIEKLKTDIITFQNEYRRLLKKGLEKKDKEVLSLTYQGLSLRAKYIREYLIDKDTNLQKLFDEKVIGTTTKNKLAKAYEEGDFDIIGPLISEHTKLLEQARNDTVALVEKMDSNEWQELPLTEKQKLFDEQIDKNRAVINQHLIEVQKVVDDFAHTRDFDLPDLVNVFAQSINLIKKFQAEPPISDPASDIKEQMRSFLRQLTKLYGEERDTGLDENITMEDIKKFIDKQDNNLQNFHDLLNANNQKLGELNGQLRGNNNAIQREQEILLPIQTKLRNDIPKMKIVKECEETLEGLVENKGKRNELKKNLENLRQHLEYAQKQKGNATLVEIPGLTKLLGEQKDFPKKKGIVVAMIKAKIQNTLESLNKLDVEIAELEKKINEQFSDYSNFLKEINSKEAQLKDKKEELKKINSQITKVRLFGRPTKFIENKKKIEKAITGIEQGLMELYNTKTGVKIDTETLMANIAEGEKKEAEINERITALEEEKKEIETEITYLTAANNAIEEDIKAREDNQQTITDSKNLFANVLQQKIKELKSSVEEIKSAQKSVNWTIEAFLSLIDNIPKAIEENVVDLLKNALARVTKIDVLQKSSDELLTELGINITVAEE